MNLHNTFPYRRICVVGVTGSGKSTVACEIARRLEIPHIELDALYWKPGWTHCSEEEMHQKTDEATRSDAWVVDGNYSKVRDVTWPRAEVIVWLDFPLALILWRLWKRTWKRILTRENLWGTNSERLWPQFFSKDSLFLWAIKTYRKRKNVYQALLSSPEYSHLNFFRFKTSKETDAWLNNL